MIRKVRPAPGEWLCGFCDNVEPNSKWKCGNCGAPRTVNVRGGDVEVPDLFGGCDA